MSDHQFGVDIFEKWTAMWNGRTDLADEIMAASFDLRYAQPGTEPMDPVHTPEALSALIAHWREMRGDPTFHAEGRAVIEISGDSEAPDGTVVRPYSTTFGSDDSRNTVGGIDYLRFEGGKIVEVFSASGGVAGRSFGIA